MIKELMHDPIFLAGKSEDATTEDLQVAQDLLDTLMAHRESCVGIAANPTVGSIQFSGKEIGRYFAASFMPHRCVLPWIFFCFPRKRGRMAQFQN